MSIVNWPISVTDRWRVNGNIKILIVMIWSYTMPCIVYSVSDSKSDIVVIMFCADYVASFIHHGIIVGLWCEYNKRLETDKHIDTDSISSVKSVFAGCLAGNAICSR